MIVNGTSPPVVTGTPAPTPTRDPGTAPTAAPADAFGLLFGLLAQATPSVVPAAASMPPPVAGGDRPVATDEPEPADANLALAIGAVGFCAPARVSTTIPPTAPVAAPASSVVSHESAAPAVTRDEPALQLVATPEIAIRSGAPRDGTPVPIAPGDPAPTPAGGPSTSAADGLVEALSWPMPAGNTRADPAEPALDAVPDVAADTATPTSSTRSLDAAVQLTARVEAAATAREPHVVVRSVHVAVDDARWPQQVGHEVRLLVERGVQSATLRVTPEHLGPVDVRIDIVNDKANVQFGAAQAETRHALADAIPRLRELLAGSGVVLGDASVRPDANGAFTQPAPRRAPERADDVRREVAEASVEPRAMTARIGLIDAYA